MQSDVLIIGAGPTGLCLSLAFAGLGLDVALVERQGMAQIAEPAFDGREIALTHASMRLLDELGLWQRFTEQDVSPLRAARVLNGRSPHGMDVNAPAGEQGRLGSLVPNHRIRQVAWDAVGDSSSVRTHFDVRVARVNGNDDHAEVELQDGRILRAPLLVAADSRFSETRRALGLTADHHDFGKTMIVCRMRHRQPHHGVAWEWFDHGQTLALLPLQEYTSSTVLTLTGTEAQRVMALPEDDFSREMERRYQHRLGEMELISTRHAYPLVGVFARHFVGRRFALAGDAAVGMHPVTAHGFNLGLGSVERLRELARTALAQGRDLGDAALLSRYQRHHRAATRPLYLATRAIVDIFTDDRRPMRMAREAILRTGQRMPPLRRALAATLMDAGPVDSAPWQRLGSLLPR